MPETTEHLTDETTEAEAPSTPVESDTDTPDNEHDNQDQEPQGNRANRDAARYRRKLRDTEARLETTEATVEALQQQIAEDALRTTGNGIAPDVFFRLGLNVNEYATDSGTIDVDALTQHANTMVREFGLKGRRPDPSQSAQGYSEPEEHLLFRNQSR